MAKPKDLDPLDTFLEDALIAVETDTHFGPFTKIRPIGHGAHGEVWEVTDPAGRPWALKALRQVELIERFQREVDKLASLDHPHILKLHDADLEFSPPYFVCPLLSGGSLKDRLSRGPLSLPDTYRLALELSSALVTLEQQGLIHRDLKPANLLFDQHGALHLADFGIVKRDADSLTTTLELTRTGQSLGTSAYMSPEQLQGKNELSTKLDIFAFGIVLYECLTGQRPFAPTEKTRDLISAAILRDPPQALPPSVPAELTRLIFSCLEKNPAKRPGAGKIWEKLEKIGKKPTPTNDPFTTAKQAGTRPTHPTQEPVLMNDKITNLTQAAATLTRLGFSLNARLQETIANLQNPKYKVAIVGQYQVGKSTLINKVFLKDEFLLIQGEGLATTATCTEVTYGLQKQLDITPWQIEMQTVTIDGKTFTVPTKVGTGSPISKLNPTPEDLTAATTAEGEEARTALADHTASVKLSWPSESLKRYTIFDTPGINDPNEELLRHSTYRIVPEVDVAILIVDASKDLSISDKEFLRKGLAEQGLSHILILRSYKADKNSLPATQLSKIESSVKSFLISNGRSHIPVATYCYDQTVSQTLNSPAAIEDYVLQFLDANVAQSRLSRARYLVKTEINTALLKLRAELALADKSATDKERILNDLRKKETELKLEAKSLMDDATMDIGQLKRHAVQSITQALKLPMKEFHRDIEACDNLESLKNLLKNGEKELGLKFEAALYGASKEAQTDLKLYSEKLGQKLRLPDIGVPGLNLQPDGMKGMLLEIPNIVVTGMDIVITCILVPGGMIWNILERFMLPLVFKWLKGITPSGLALKWIKGSVKEELDKAINDLPTQINTALDGAYSQLEVAIRNGFDKLYVEQIGNLRKVAEDAVAQTITPARRQELAHAEVELSQLTTNLN